MPRFRKKPIVIEAERFVYTAESWPEGVFEKEGRVMLVNTLEGVMGVADGDWIITGIQGERYPCKPDIFEQTYEAVNG